VTETHVERNFTMTVQVLMIVTSNARMGETGKATGFWAEELALPYYAFTDAGAGVTLASPQGGAVPLDPGSVKPKGQNAPVVERFLADTALQAHLAHTVRVQALAGSAFDAVFFPGGHGTMWDLPGDAGVTAVVETAFATGKVIASVCHGAAGLVSARRPHGAPIVQGARINSFTDAEEAAVGLAGVVPFALESRLRELGAAFEGAPMWQAFVVRDGQFVTGQNPQSSALVAHAVIDALGLPTQRAAA
jgi:putative intracellular protease/amidase